MEGKYFAAVGHGQWYSLMTVSVKPHLLYIHAHVVLTDKLSYLLMFLTVR